tara:strand:- start:16 stop:999 length:984 start_codon:yes stop_codon:yes gene_type:complete
MRAVLIHEFGDPDNLAIAKIELPIPGPDEILVKVKATALNRADILQRRGFYPPPPGSSSILGLEIAGYVEQIGKRVENWKTGDRVFGLLAGGGYAEFATIHKDIAMAIPDELSFNEAAAIPEVFLTAFQALSYLAKLQKGEQILIHAGASGVGTAAIQLSKIIGASSIIVTASKGKHTICEKLGANITIDYKTLNFETEINGITEGKGVDVIIDFLAAPYFQKNLNSMNFDGRMIMLALMGGATADQVDLKNILSKRIRVIGSTLRARSENYKIKLTQDFKDFALKRFVTGELQPVIDKVYHWEDVIDAHRYMESNQNIGKIILNIS